MSKKELDHLYLTKNERMGILILFILLLTLILVPWCYYNLETNESGTEDQKHSFISSAQRNSKDSIDVKQALHIESNNRLVFSGKKTEYELFYFDPNTFSKNEATRLGISEKSYSILQKYLATGAKIKTATQFSKIYGIDKNTFQRIEPFIKIHPADVILKTKSENKREAVSKINLNTATLEELISLPGIAEKLASRIIKYRNLLGGFIDESQLKEIYGLQDSVIQNFSRLIFISGDPDKINLNESDSDVLAKHPYIGPAKAKIICEYRKQHSGMDNLQDLHKIKALDTVWIQRVSEYLSF